MAHSITGSPRALKVAAAIRAVAAEYRDGGSLDGTMAARALEDLAEAWDGYDDHVTLLSIVEDAQAAAKTLIEAAAEIAVTLAKEGTE